MADSLSEFVVKNSIEPELDALHVKRSDMDMSLVRNAESLSRPRPAPTLPGLSDRALPGGVLASTGVATLLGACRGGSFPR